MTGGLRNTKNVRDANHAVLADRYRAQMCLVLDLSKVGFGCPDILVKIPTRQGGILNLVEVKTEEGTLSPSQERFMRDWGGTAWLVRTVEDVDNHVSIVRRMFK